jgi:hypothetical protein
MDVAPAVHRLSRTLNALRVIDEVAPQQWETRRTAFKLQDRAVERKSRELVEELGENNFESERPPSIDSEVGENFA